MLVPTRRLPLIRRCARRPRGVSLLVWRAPRGADFQECGSGRRACQTSRSRRRFVTRRPRLPLTAAGRRTTLRAPAGGSRWRRLAAVASKLLSLLRVASAARRRARRGGGCAACCFYSASRPRRRRVRLTCGGRRLSRLQRLQGCVTSTCQRGRTGRSAAAADRTKRCGESACNERFTSTLEACSGYRSNRTRSEAEH